jgi:hypothetical protein
MANSILFQSLTESQQSNFNSNLEQYFPHPDFTKLSSIFLNPKNTCIESLNADDKELLLEYIQ